MNRWLRRIALVVEVGVVLLALAGTVLFCSIPSTDKLARQNPTSTAFIDLRRAEAAAEGKSFNLKWQWRPLGKISRYLRAAVIFSEDWKFYEHDGVDWDAIEKAIDANLAKGSLSVGGSTITQQLAKNLYLSPSRSMVRKLRELLIAFSLEDSLSKQRILELYLNVAEWGDGIFGAEAAAQHWFKHSAQSLTPAEAVRLAIALPNPFKRAPNVRTKDLRKRAVRLLRILRVQGLIDTAQERTALDAVGAGKTPVLAKTKKLRDLADDENDDRNDDSKDEPVTSPGDPAPEKTPSP